RQTIGRPSWRRLLSSPQTRPSCSCGTTRPHTIPSAWPPFRSPELMPCEDLWRSAKAQVAANRAYREEPQSDTVLQLLAAQGVACSEDPSTFDRLRCSSLLRTKLAWSSPRQQATCWRKRAKASLR